MKNYSICLMVAALLLSTLVIAGDEIGGGGKKSMVATSAMVREIELRNSEGAEFIEEARLFDGRKIDFKNDVERTHLFEHKVDFLELKSGEIVDRSDILSIKLPDANRAILDAFGVDGGR
ncbi:MAG: hypothetical protein A2X86_19745 [Bdellovibrionales bacterium GWA2_49_15]|nr:MAG: hypothetical protein A2X86_19745 [Bdellovibrionales bacterium GWA2_49_15]HAZ12493.1 hypothetical protein [Bdellovibrionales bacterium]